MKVVNTIKILFIFSLLVMPITMVGSLPSEGQGYGGTFRRPLKVEPSSVIPDLKYDYGASAIGGDLWPQLVGVDWGVVYGIPGPQGVQFDLASSYDLSADGLTHTFNLRNDAVWTDGEPINSDDVLYSLNWILNDERARFHFKFIDEYGVLEVEAPDEYTIVIKTNKFNSDWLLVFAQDNGHGFKIYPEHIWEGTDPFENPERVTPTVTGGPYTIDTWAKGQYILLKKNPDYYLAPFPFVDFVLLKIMNDANTIWTALLADELDSITYEMSPAFPVQKLVMQGAYPGIELFHTGSIYSYPLKINHEHPILSNKLVRQGVATAINRQEIVSKGFQDVWPANTHYAHEGSVWENPDAAAPSYNKKEAERLLDLAGYPIKADGWRFELDLTAMPVTAPMTSAEIIKGQLEDVGIKINYEITDQPTAEAKIRAGDFALVTEWTRYGPSPNDGYYACWHSEGRYNLGRFRFNNAEYDAIIEEALTVSDFTERKELFFRAQEILADEVAEIPIVYEQKNLISNADWHGQTAQPDGWGVNGNWWGNRAVWSDEFVETDVESEEISEIKEELVSLATRLEATSEGLASGLNKIADSMDILSSQISDTDDTSGLDERLESMSSTISTLQTISIVTLLAVIVALVIPFVRKN